METHKTAMHHTVSKNTSKSFSTQFNGDISFNFGVNKSINEEIKSAIASKVGPKSREKEVNPQTCKWLGKVQNFQYWINDDPRSHGLLWVIGGPGKGKTHLSTRLVTQLPNTHTLSYFCDAGSIQHSTELAVVLGLLNQLLELEEPEESYRVIADKFSGLRQDLFSDSYIADLWSCFEKIIRKKSQKDQLYLVLDGLDECNSSSQTHLTTQLKKICDQNRQEMKNLVKIVIFSRPLDLHNLADLTIDLDKDEILKWTTGDIRAIVKESCLLEHGEKEFCDILTKRANGTFLWVALAVSFLDDRTTQHNIVNGDSAFLDQLLPIGLDAMYNRMLINVLDRLYGKAQFKAMIKIFRCLAVSLHPLTREEVGAITELDSHIVEDAIQGFRHVLSITGEGSSDEAIELVHLSLREFLVRNSSSQMAEDKCWLVWPSLYFTASWLRENRFRLWLVDYAILATMSIFFQNFLHQHPSLTFGFFSLVVVHFVCQKHRSSLLIGYLYRAFERWINKVIMTIFCIREQELHRFVFERCVALMIDRTKGLQRDICDTEYLRGLRNKVAIEERCRRVRYPARYWIRHFERSEPTSCGIDKLYKFLEEQFLHWLEAMGIFGVISEAVGQLDIINRIIQDGASTEVSQFINDARRFILKIRHIAGIEPLQIYYAGLVFAPVKSIIRKKFRKEIRQISTLPKVEEFWSAELQTLEGHSELVRSVAFSSDGRLLASSSDDETVRIWDTATGALKQTLEGFSGAMSVAFSPDGQLLASGCRDDTVRIWDMATGALKQTLEGFSGAMSVAFSPDGQLLASSSQYKTVRLWDIVTGAVHQNIAGYPESGASDSSYSVAFSFDGQLLAAGSQDHLVRLWDMATGALLQTLDGHTGSVMSVAFSPDSRLLASSSFDKTVRLWDTTTGNLQETLKNHSESVNSVAFSSDGQQLASGSQDEKVRLWNTATGELQRTLRGHSGAVTSVAFAPKSQLLASSSGDKTVRLWDTEIGALKSTPDSHSDSVYSVAFSLDGRLLASCSYDETVRLWDTVTGDLQQTFEGHSDSVISVALSPNSQQLASGSQDETVRLWDTATGVLKQTLEGHSGPVLSVQFSPDGQLLATGSYDGTVQLWDTGHTATAVLQQTLEGHAESVNAVAFSPDGRMLASGSYDDTVRLWDTVTYASQTLEGHSESVNSVAFSPDGRLLASSSDDETVRLWNTMTGTLEQTLTFIGKVTGLEFAQDSSYLHTNIGSLEIQPMYGNQAPQSPVTTRGISLQEDQWILLNGEKLLWLPIEARPSCSAIKANTLALGHRSGRISFFGFQMQ